MKAPALKQLKAADTLLWEKNWDKARVEMEAMLKDKEYRFADPYLLLALIKMNYGKREEAIAFLERGLEMATFTKLAIIKKEFLEALKAALENEETAALEMTACVQDPLSLLNGKLPEKAKEVMAFATEKEVKTKKTYESEEAHTGLTEDDEEWLKKHNLD